MDEVKALGLRKKIEKALESLSKEEGVSIDIGNATFDSNSVTFNKLSITDDAVDGSKQTKESIDFIKYAKAGLIEGMTEDMLGKTFESQGKTFKIEGYKPRASKKPILASDESDNLYIFPINMVLKAMQVNKDF